MKKLIIVLFVLLVVVLIIGFMPSPAEPEPEAVPERAAVDTEVYEVIDADTITFTLYDDGTVDADMHVTALHPNDGSALIYLTVERLIANGYMDFTVQGELRDNNDFCLKYADGAIVEEGSHTPDNLAVYTLDEIEAYAQGFGAYDFEQIQATIEKLGK